MYEDSLKVSNLLSLTDYCIQILRYLAAYYIKLYENILISDSDSSAILDSS